MGITNKQQMYQLFDVGMFGNAGINFSSAEEAYEYLTNSSDSAAIMIRTKRPGGRCDPNIRRFELFERVIEFINDGYSLNELQYSLMMPDHNLRLQGYVMRHDLYGLWLDYSDIPGMVMREAMKSPKHLHGFTVYWLLKGTMDTPSWEQLQHLLDEYPNHVVEFTTYNELVGNLMWNSIFWEVRQY